MNARELRRIARTQRRRLAGLCRSATASLRALPDFLIAGESKCGTTSLYDDICRHPSVIEAAVKEVHFFDMRYGRGAEWYRSQFPLERRMRRDGARTARLQTGEASPYYMFHPHALSRIRRMLPDVKLIAMLRNPVDRAYSQYQHEFRSKREPLSSFEQAIDREPERLKGERERMLADESYHSHSYRRHSYVTRGIYVEQLQAVVRQFDRSQLLVIRSEDYFSTPEAVLRRVIEFLGLPAWNPGQFARKNVGSYSPIEPKVRRRLCDFFAPHNARLYAWVGEDYGWR